MHGSSGDVHQELAERILVVGDVNYNKATEEAAMCDNLVIIQIKLDNIPESDLNLY